MDYDLWSFFLNTFFCFYLVWISLQTLTENKMIDSVSQEWLLKLLQLHYDLQMRMLESSSAIVRNNTYIVWQYFTIVELSHIPSCSVN